MIQWFKKHKTKRFEEEKHNENEWVIYFSSYYISLNQPKKYSSSQLRFNWVEMQVKTLKQIQRQLPNTHTYIRFSTLFPKSYSDIITNYQTEIVKSKKRKEKVFLFQDYQNLDIIWSLLRFPILPYELCVFMLENNPPEWREIINKLFGNIIANKRRPFNKYINQLSECTCLCYILDENLIIDKVELSEDIIVSILENVARKEELELVIERENKKM